jgi:hypothetical protein
MAMSAIVGSDLPTWYEGVFLASRARRRKGQELGVRMEGTQFSQLSFEITRIGTLEAGWKTLNELPLRNTAWAPYVAAAKFESNPTSQGLSDALAWLGTVWEGDPAWEIVYPFAWPLAGCLGHLKGRESVSRLAERATEGGLGALTDWLQAEQRWARSGATMNDWECMSRMYPWDADIGSVGFPFAAAFAREPGQPSEVLWRSLVRLFEGMPDGMGRIVSADVTLRILERDVLAPELLWDTVSPELLKGLLEARAYLYVDVGSISRAINASVPLTSDWITLFEWIGGEERREMIIPASVIRWSDSILEAFLADPTRIGLLPTLAIAALSGSQVVVPMALLRTAAIALTEKVSIERTGERLLAPALLGICAAGDEQDFEWAQETIARAAEVVPNATALALQTLRNQDVDTVAAVTFACGLRPLVLRRNRLGRQVLDDFILGAIRKDASRLWTSDAWKELGFPTWG